MSSCFLTAEAELPWAARPPAWYFLYDSRKPSRTIPSPPGTAHLYACSEPRFRRAAPVSLFSACTIQSARGLSLAEGAKSNGETVLRLLRKKIGEPADAPQSGAFAELSSQALPV